MSSLHEKKCKRTIPLASPLLWLSQAIAMASLSLFDAGCAYRFSNTHIARSPGMRTIAIESIYDTSRESLPHEVFWEAIQRAFAADGHLRVVSRSEADVLIRAHITDGAVTPSEPTNASKNIDDVDPDVFVGSLPPDPRSYKRLSTAREHAGKENVLVMLTVEAWHTHTGRLLMRKDYTTQRQFNSLPDPTQLSNNATLPYYYIRYDEALVNQLDLGANDISSQIVRDFLTLIGT